MNVNIPFNIKTHLPVNLLLTKRDHSANVTKTSTGMIVDY